MRKKRRTRQITKKRKEEKAKIFAALGRISLVAVSQESSRGWRACAQGKFAGAQNWVKLREAEG